jgi:hypothetical protein
MLPFTTTLPAAAAPGEQPEPLWPQLLQQQQLCTTTFPAAHSYLDEPHACCICKLHQRQQVQELPTANALVCARREHWQSHASTSPQPIAPCGKLAVSCHLCNFVPYGQDQAGVAHLLHCLCEIWLAQHSNALCAGVGWQGGCTTQVCQHCHINCIHGRQEVKDQSPCFLLEHSTSTAALITVSG